LKAISGSLIDLLGLRLLVLLLLNFVKWSWRCGWLAPDELPGTYCGYTKVVGQPLCGHSHIWTVAGCRPCIHCDARLKS